MLQLVCPGDPFTCSGNTAGGSCQVSQFSGSQCLFSSTAQQYVRIQCAASTVVTTFQPGGGAMMFRALEEAAADLEAVEEA